MCKHWLKRSGKNVSHLEEVLESIKQNIPSTSVVASLIQLGYQNQLGKDYKNEGILPQAINEYVAMVSSREEILGPNHFSTRRLGGLLVGLLHDNGQLEESAELALKRIEIIDHVSDPNNEHLLLKDKLAAIYKDLGRLEDSETLTQEVLEEYSANLEGNKALRVAALLQLSVISLERGRHEEAVQRGLIAIEENTQLLGPNHNNTLVAKSVLATAYTRMGELKIAVELNEEVAQVGEANNGADHPDTIETLDRLGLQYYMLGKYEASQDRYKRVMDNRVSHLGRANVNTLRAINDYTTILPKLGRVEEAAAIQEELLEEIKSSLGSEHEETIRLMGNLGVTYQIQGLWDKAEALEKDVLSFRQNKLGNEHASTLVALRNLSDTMFNQGKWDEAAKLSISEFKTRQGISVQPDQEKLIALFKATRSLSRLENWEATIIYIEHELVHRAAFGGKDYLEDLQALAIAATSCMKLQQWVAAQDHVAAFLARSLQGGSYASNLVIKTVHELAILCQENRWLEEAEQLLILELLMLQKFAPAESTVIEERVKTFVELKRQQKKPVAAIIYDPTAIIERARQAKNFE